MHCSTQLAASSCHDWGWLGLAEMLTATRVLRDVLNRGETSGLSIKEVPTAILTA